MSKIKDVAMSIRSAMEASGLVTLTANGPNGETGLQQFFEVLAMDAIEAMREPTQEMLNAAPNMIRAFAKKDWQAMIDAALNEKTPAQP